MDERSEKVDQLVDHLFRHEVGRMVSRLTRILGAQRLAMAEDAVQYAMLQALELWPYQDVPDYPQAWLAKVAYHRALDILKGERKLRFYDDDGEVTLRKQISKELQDAKTRRAFRILTRSRGRETRAHFCLLPSGAASPSERRADAKSRVRIWR